MNRFKFRDISQLKETILHHQIDLSIKFQFKDKTQILNLHVSSD